MLAGIAFALGSHAGASATRLTSFDSVGSTNTAAMDAARAGDAGPHWFVTSDQNAGKGRRNRAWVMPRGNLAASILNVMEITPARAATLGFVAGLSVIQAVEAVIPDARDRVALKWPNDCLADGKKFVGIDVHAEHVASGKLAVVAGIGINVIAAPQGTPTPATALKDCGFDVNAANLFAALSDAWMANFAVWDEGRGFASFREAWLARAAYLGQTLSVVNGGQKLVGTFETIDDGGCLVLRAEDGSHRQITAGDVFFGDARSAGAA